MEPQLETIRVGVCAIVGLPNVGKSTLLNDILGVRMAAVSPRPQTTRNRILGVSNRQLPAAEDGEVEPAQIIFVDTPGVQTGPGALRRYMKEQALSAAADCDVALLLVDVAEPEQRSPQAFEGGDGGALADALRRAGVPLILALNKVDRLADKAQLLPIIEAYAATGQYQDIVPISAKSGDGVDRLVELVGRRLSHGPRLFPDEMYTDRSERFLAGELIREQLFRQLGKEVPYATAVEVEAFHDRSERGDVVISAVIHVERDSQRGIVVGKQGQRIKEIGTRGREAISQLLGCPVHLKLHVKVSPDWSRKERTIRELGYD